MALVQATDYRCTVCASYNISVIRQDAVNPKLKCNACKFTFNGKDSAAADAAGVIQPASPEVLATATEPEREVIPHGQSTAASVQHNGNGAVTLPALPKMPSHLFIDKVRSNFEVCSKRDFKKVAVRWSQGGSFDIYELKKIQLKVKVDIT